MIPQKEAERAGSGFAVTAYGRPGNRSQRKLIIPTDLLPWDERQDQVISILGYTTYGIEKEFKRFLPWFDPEDRKLAAVRCETRGVGYDGENSPESYTYPMATANQYKEIEFTIYFESVRETFGTFYNITDPTNPQLGETPTFEQNRYIIKRIRPGREFLNAQPGAFVWANTGGTADPTLTVNYPLPTIIPYQEIDVTWLDIPVEAVPFTAITDCLGKINSMPIDIPGPGDLNYLDETLMLNSVSDEETYFPNGDLAYNLTYHMMFRPVVSTVGVTRQGWNIRQHPDGSYRPVFRKGTSDGIYLKDNFQRLFVPEP